MTSNILSQFFLQLKSLCWLLKDVRSMLAILHVFAPCEIMRLINGFMGYVTGFSRHYNDAERKFVSLSTWPISNWLFFILMSRSKKIASMILPFSLCNSNSSGYTFVKLLSNIPSSLIVFKPSVKQKTLNNFLALVKSFFWRSSILLLS